MSTYELFKDLLIPVTSIVVSVLVARWTTLYIIGRESKNGRLRLLELTRRFFINYLNAYDSITWELNQTLLAKAMYVEELKAILNEVQELVSNPFFSLLAAENPLLSKLIVQCRRELVEHEVGTESFSLNAGTIREFGELHNLLCVELPKITKTELDKEIARICLKNVSFAKSAA